MSQLALDEALRPRYCPPLDEALFFALASDFDLSNDEQLEQLEQILNGLKEQAVVEQDLELAQPVHHVVSHTSSNNAHSRTPSTRPKTAGEDTLASVTTGISGLTTSETDDSNTDYQDLHTLPQGLESASLSDKERWLQALFPTIEAVQITETLSRSLGDLQNSIDELLNLSFIHDDIDQNYVPPPVLKGVRWLPRRRQAEKRAKQRKAERNQGKDDYYHSDGQITRPGAATPNSNVWQSASRDVEFIISRTQMSETAVKSYYHQNNLNLAMTIRSLVTLEADAQVSENQHQDFQGVPENHIYGALLLANMLPSAAKDLLDAMLRRPRRYDTASSGKIIAQYTPLNLSEDDAPVKKTPRSSTIAADPALLAGQAGVHSASASRAFEQAGSAFRRGRSDRLMGGAAAYYASVGHEQRKRHKELMAGAYDAHVLSQSSSSSLDLHGVTVEHAVRIAKSSVEDWWERLGDRKYRVGGIGEGYKIIVGVGTHSANGIGRIGPAVSRMLMREGWKVNIQRGEVIVEGRARR